MKHQFPSGVWPVMLTPFTEDNRVDYPALGRLVDWYISAGVAGLFAVCQSSEMFFLSPEERVEIARFVKAHAAGRVPVVASGHVSDNLSAQAEELNQMAATGVDAVILLTNRLAAEAEDDSVWLQNLQKLLVELPADVPLGFYECPYPYKRILSPTCLSWCAQSGRFYFLKDTSCDVQNMREKLAVLQGTNMKLFNANSATLLQTLHMGAAGFSGVMANFHPDLYVWLCAHAQDKQAQAVSDFVSIAALIERQVYPVNAKFHLQKLGVLGSLHTRVKDASLLGPTAQEEVLQLARLSEAVRKTIR